MVKWKKAHTATELVRWYRRVARDLPWRRTRDPYGIWVSEIMLQQTQAGTVIPYWRRWMRELPTVEALSKARLDRVLKLWEGLGYYSRARRLREAAVIMMTRHGGRVPDDVAGLEALPGIGRYTAGAIASIAFGVAAPVLDGNVRRVLARFRGVSGDPESKRVTEELWRLAEELVCAAAESREAGRSSCGDLNQAMMELGATVCTPRKPGCGKCPLRAECIARVEDRVEELPGRGRSVRVTRRKRAAFLVERRGRWLVRRVATGRVNGGLWEFPTVELEGRDGVRRALRDLLGDARLVESDPVLVIRHSITRYRIEMAVYRVHARPGMAGVSGMDWVRTDRLDGLAFSAAHRRVIREVLRGARGGGRQSRSSRPRRDRWRDAALAGVGTE